MPQMSDAELIGDDAVDEIHTAGKRCIVGRNFCSYVVHETRHFM